MAKKDKQREKFNFYDYGESSGGGGTRCSKNDYSPISSDDEEANEDLSLKIIEKARLMRAAKLLADESGEYDLVLRESKDCAGYGVGGAVDLSSSSVRQSEAGDGPSGFKGCKVVLASGEGDLVKKIRKVKRRLKIKKVETEEKVDMEKEESNEKVEDLALPVEPNDVGMTDNIVFRKLLRGPRYFDPPCSVWEACFNCGEEGHNAVNCTAQKRKKPCFVCGSLDHNAKGCLKSKNCFICKKDGHRANKCPEGSNAKSKMCLKCGDPGHDMYLCQNDYSLDDLKNIQCYICKNFGHLCCISPMNATQEVSCYKCGQAGHTGLACARLRQEVTGTGTPSGCYKCGEEGHFARECLSSSKANARLSQEVTGLATPSSCFKCGEERHFARDCPNSTKVSKRNLEPPTPTNMFHMKQKGLLGCKSEPNNLSKGSRKKKPKYEQIDAKAKTSQKSRCRGGWMVKDPGDFSPSRPKIKHWGNPVTPPSRNQMAPFSFADNYTRFIPSPNMHNVHHGSPMSQGSNYGFQPRFSSSRFANSGGGGGGMWRNHNW